MHVTEAIHFRRAYRSLRPAAISDTLIRDLAEHASLAPSCFNNQPWRFVFARDPQVLADLRPALSRGNAWVTTASMIIAVFTKADLDCTNEGRGYYLFDAGLAVATLVLRATELGLVAHPIAGYKEAAVKAALNIPEDMTVITLVNVGKHSKEINPILTESQAAREKSRPERKTFEEFAFIDRYPAGREE